MKNNRNKKESVEMRMCTVTGLTRPITEFYSGHNHLKAVDNLRRTSGATKEQIKRMFTNLQLSN